MHGPTFEEAEPEVLTQEQFSEELDNDLATMITQDPFDEEADERQIVEGGAERRAGEAAEGDEEEEDDEGDDDVDEEDGYEIPKDPFPHEPRRRQTDEEMDKDFDLNKKVGI
jgi:hypothetical protein